MNELNGFRVNEIVKGKVCGTFVILAFTQVGFDMMAILKEVNPNNHAQTAKGELALPIDALVKA